jgi:hypothetical protein
MASPKVSEHGGELILLSLIALGVLVLIGMMIVATWGDQTARQTLGDVSPFLLIEQAIISAIKDRWQARLQGQSNQLLGAATPAAGPSAAGEVARNTPPPADEPLDLKGSEIR